MIARRARLDDGRAPLRLETGEQHGRLHLRRRDRELVVDRAQRAAFDDERRMAVRRLDGRAHPPQRLGDALHRPRGERLVADELEPSLLAGDESGEEPHERARVAAVDRARPARAGHEPDAVNAQHVHLVLDDLAPSARTAAIVASVSAERPKPESASRPRRPPRRGRRGARSTCRPARRRARREAETGSIRTGVESTVGGGAPGPGTISRCGSSPASGPRARRRSATTRRLPSVPADAGAGRRRLLHCRPPLDHVAFDPERPRRGTLAGRDAIRDRDRSGSLDVFAQSPSPRTPRPTGCSARRRASANSGE